MSMNQELNEKKPHGQRIQSYLDVSNINSSASLGFCTQYNQCCYFYNFHGLLSHTDDSDCNLRNPTFKLPHFNLDL